MSTNAEGADKDSARDSTAADKSHFADLTAFQRDLLWAMHHAGPSKGVTLREVLEDYYGESINHGQLYPNLDELVGAGLVSKSQRDRRTNEYALTETANRALQRRVAFVEDGEVNC